MRYVALQLREIVGELGGIRAVIDDLAVGTNSPRPIFDMNLVNPDTGLLTRAFSTFLIRHGWPTNDNGQVVITAFGDCDLGLLKNVETWWRYIQTTGGIHNPVLLFCDGDVMPRLESRTPENVIKMIRHYYALKGRV